MSRSSTCILVCVAMLSAAAVSPSWASGPGDEPPAEIGRLAVRLAELRRDYRGTFEGRVTTQTPPSSGKTPDAIREEYIAKHEQQLADGHRDAQILSAPDPEQERRRLSQTIREDADTVARTQTAARVTVNEFRITTTESASLEESTLISRTVNGQDDPEGVGKVTAWLTKGQEARQYLPESRFALLQDIGMYRNALLGVRAQFFCGNAPPAALPAESLTAWEEAPDGRVVLIYAFRKDGWIARHDEYWRVTVSPAAPWLVEGYRVIGNLGAPEVEVTFGDFRQLSDGGLYPHHIVKKRFHGVGTALSLERKAAGGKPWQQEMQDAARITSVIVSEYALTSVTHQPDLKDEDISLPLPPGTDVRDETVKGEPIMYRIPDLSAQALEPGVALDLGLPTGENRLFVDCLERDRSGTVTGFGGRTANNKGWSRDGEKARRLLAEPGLQVGFLRDREFVRLSLLTVPGQSEPVIAPVGHPMSLLENVPACGQ